MCTTYGLGAYLSALQVALYLFSYRGRSIGRIKLHITEYRWDCDWKVRVARNGQYLHEAVMCSDWYTRPNPLDYHLSVIFCYPTYYRLLSTLFLSSEFCARGWTAQAMLQWPMNNVSSIFPSGSDCIMKRIYELIACNPVNANVPGTDFIVQSSDGVVFHLHRKNLQLHTDDTFPGLHDSGSGPTASLNQNTILVTEPSSILDIVFRFMYPRRQPRIKVMDFQTILAVADAVEKYKFFAAMNLCEEALMWVSDLYYICSGLGLRTSTNYRYLHGCIPEITSKTNHYQSFSMRSGTA